MPPEPQKKFMWFLFLWNEHAMLSNTPLCCSACPTYESGNSRNERVKKKACATMAGSFFCVEAITFMKVYIRIITVGEILACPTEGFSVADFDFNSSEHLLWFC